MSACLSVRLSEGFQTVTTHSLKKHILAYFPSNERARQLLLIDDFNFLNLKKLWTKFENLKKVLILREFHLNNRFTCVEIDLSKAKK